MKIEPHQLEVLRPVIIHQVGPEKVCDFHFLQVPSPFRGLPQKGWVIHDLPRDFSCVAIQPIHDLPVALRIHEEPLQPLIPGRSEIHCLQLSTGRPHPRAKRVGIL